MPANGRVAGTSRGRGDPARKNPKRHADERHVRRRADAKQAITPTLDIRTPAIDGPRMRERLN